MDLTKFGDVYGELDSCRSETGDCKIKSVEIGGDGFIGNYGVPSTINTEIETRRLLGTHRMTAKQLF